MVLRGLPLLIELALTIFCLVDCIQTPEEVVRNLPRWAWILLILLFPIVGAIAWLVAGRPTRDLAGTDFVTGFRTGAPGAHRAPAAPIGPDDDPEFLRELGRVNSEHERTLEKWERDLRRREEDLRRREQGTTPEGD